MSVHTFAAIATILLLAISLTFAGFYWYPKNNEQNLYMESDHDKGLEGGCPFYPQPKKIVFSKYPEFSKLFDWLDNYANSIVDPEAIPSISANLVYLDQVVWKGNFGRLSKQSDQPPTENTIYRIASISKLFPVIYLFKLWEDGKVDLHDAVTKYAPDFTLQPQMGTPDDINLIDMASQISGLAGYFIADLFFGNVILCSVSRDSSLPFNPLNGSVIIYNGTLEDAFGLMKHNILAAEPRSKCIYSNLAYAFLGHILSRNFSDGNFTGWAKKNVVDTLGLTNTGFRYTQDILSKMATGYMNDGTTAPVYDLKWYGPAGNYYSSSADLAVLSMSFLETSRASILKHNSLKEMLRSRKVCQHGYFDGTINYTGSPWEMNTIYDNLIVRKDGDIEGYSSTMALVPSLKLAFNVLMSGNRKENVASKVLQKVIPVFRDTLRRMEQEIKPTPNPEKYTGVYSYYGLQTQTIKEGSGGILLMQNLAATGRYNTSGLSFVDEGVFRLKILGGSFPCPVLDAQNDDLLHFRNFTNGKYNEYDFPELFVYGFRRKS